MYYRVKNNVIELSKNDEDDNINRIIKYCGYRNLR